MWNVWDEGINVLSKPYSVKKVKYISVFLWHCYVIGNSCTSYEERTVGRRSLWTVPMLASLKLQPYKVSKPYAFAKVLKLHKYSIQTSHLTPLLLCVLALSRLRTAIREAFSILFTLTTFTEIYWKEAVQKKYFFFFVINIYPMAWTWALCLWNPIPANSEVKLSKQFHVLW